MNQKNYTDQQIECLDCGQSFTFSAEDQEFYEQKGYSTPKRCPECRAQRKAASSRGNNRSRGGYGNKPQYKVICSACGCETTVPFEPRNDRPVYCSNCYKNS